MTPELTQLHHITSDELKLLQSYRLLSQPCRDAILSLAESQANSRIQYGGNVVPFRPAQTA